MTKRERFELISGIADRTLNIRELCGVLGLLLLAGAAFLLWVAFAG
jgi:hypothetical protein